MNKDLQKEWREYLEQTTRHVTVMETLLSRLGIDKKAETPGRLVCRHNGNALVAAMELARDGGAAPDAVQLVAAECVTLAETKDHTNWSLLCKMVLLTDPKTSAALDEACKAVEDEEDEHLYHTKGWVRELWLQSLGAAAVLPPPEEANKVTSAIGAAHAEQTRDLMLAAKDQ